MPKEIDWTKPVRTRGGLPLTVLHTDLCGAYPILCIWTESGRTRSVTYTRAGKEYLDEEEDVENDAVQASPEEVVEITHQKIVELLDKFVYHDCITGDCDHVTSTECAIIYYKFANDLVAEAELYV